MNITLIKYAVIVAACFAGGFGAAWKWQAANITQMELEAAHDLIESQADARDDAEGRIAAITATQNNTQTRLRTVSDDRSRADLVGNGLRITTAEAVRSSAEDATLCSDTAATLGELLNTVSAERRELAEKADKHVIDVKALKEREAAQ